MIRIYALEYDFPYSYKKEGSGPGRGESKPQRLVVIFRPDRKGSYILELSNTIADLCDSAEFVFYQEGIPSCPFKDYYKHRQCSQVFRTACKWQGRNAFLFRIEQQAS